MTSTNFVKRTLGNPAKVFSHFPLTMLSLCALAFYIISEESAAPYLGALAMETWVPFLLCAAAFGLPAVFLARRIKKGRVFSLLFQAAALILAALFVFLPRSSAWASSMLRVLPACAVAAVLMLYIPCAKGKADLGHVFSAHVRAAIAAGVVTVVLTVGIMLILGAISALLTDWGWTIRDDLLFILGIVVFPGLYLSQLPDFDEESAPEPDFTRLDRLVTKICGLPMMGVATIVFLLYMGKCAVIGVWPVGAIGPMVAVYSVWGMAAYMLNMPFDDRMARLYRKLFPFALVALTPLQLISIYLRLEPYGFTEPRYYLALFAVFSFFCGLYLLIGRGKRLHLLPLIAACLLALSLLPVIGAYDVSGQSQRARLTHLLEKNSMLSQNKVIPSGNVPIEDRVEITSIYGYLRSSGHDKETAYLSAEDKREDDSQFASLFGFEKAYGYETNAEVPKGYFRQNNQTPLAVAGFENMLLIDLAPSAGQPSPTLTASGKTYSLLYEKGGRGQLVVTFQDEAGNNVLSLDTLPLLESLSAMNASKEDPSLTQERSVSAQGGGLTARLVLNSGQAKQLSSGEVTFAYGDGYLLWGAQ